MADPLTTAEKLAALRTVAQINNESGEDHSAALDLQLDRVITRLTCRREHDRAIGSAYSHLCSGLPGNIDTVELGALIRAAVEETGATITEPPVAAKIADDTTEENDRGE